MNTKIEKTDNFQEVQEKVKFTMNIWIKRLYVLAFNIYTWFWLYRAVFINESTPWEDYLKWLFATAGMHFFVLKNNDVFFRNKKTEEIL